MDPPRSECSMLPALAKRGAVINTSVNQGRSQYEANRGICLSQIIFLSVIFSFNTLNT